MYFRCMKKRTHSRRKFISDTSKAGLALSFAPSFLKGRSSLFNNKQVRIGFIGVGLRGRNHLNNLLRNEDVECTAICDIAEGAIENSKKLFDKYNTKHPTVYTGSTESYRKMLEKEDLDGVIISTNWRWHSPIALAAMEASVYTAVEVSGAFSVEECWNWVETHERTGTHLFFLENVCYRRDVMAVLGMTRAGLFGELLHCRGGYQHDLRHVKFDNGKGGLAFGEDGIDEARWRTQHSVDRNAELYPTHGLGPIMHQLDINRGNRMTSLSSFSTKARSLGTYVQKHPDGGKDHPYSKINWSLGDIVTTQINTAKGETIMLTHDTNSPRPYSLGFRTQGTEGLIEFDYYDQRIYVEGKMDSHRWEEAKSWLEKYDHPLWKKYAETAIGGGHGGMDYFLDRQFVADVMRGAPATIDVYDAVAMKVITPLSEQSISEGGSLQHIPDFTSGKWMTSKPSFALSKDF